MNKAISLLVLIKSMTMAEKRHFRLYSRLQSGKKVYYALFKLMNNNSDVELIFKLFSEENAGKSFDVAVRHLNRIVLESLIHLRGAQDIQTKIFNYISRASILFERGVVNDAFNELRKARKLAESHEIDSLQLLIRRTELKYMSAIDFVGITEKRLIDKQMSLNEVIKYIRTANQHTQLYDILKYRIIYKGYSRSDQQKQHFNDLILSELHLLTNSSYKGFETERLHILFQSTYFLNSGNYETALRSYRDLIKLFDDNSYRMNNPPTHYLSAILGVLNSLQSADLHREMPYFISKLEQMKQGKYTTDFYLALSAHIYLNKFSFLFNSGDIESTKQLHMEYKESLFDKMSLLDMKLQLSLNLNQTILNLSLGKLNDARRSMRNILEVGKSHYNFPDYKVSRLINLLLQAELGHYDFFANEIISIKRSISFERTLYQYRTEKLLFKFIKLYPLTKNKQPREKIWSKYQSEIAEIRESKYERPLINIFDFVSWIEHKLTDKPFLEAIKDRATCPVTPHSTPVP